MIEGVNPRSQPQIEFLPPTLLRRVPQLPEGPEWQYEVKWDGYRMQALKCGGMVRLLSRNGADFTKRFAAVAQAVARLKPATLHLDGELVAMDPSGKPGFQILQGRLRLPKGWQLGYYAFDILRQGNRRFDRTPLTVRRACLEELLTGSNVTSCVKFSPTLSGSAHQVAHAVREHRLEGVVAKRVKSLYEAGKRSGSWVKLPCKQGASKFLVGGFRPSGKTFSVLLVGQFDGDGLRFAGKVRSGFDTSNRQRVFDAVKRLVIPHCPFDNLPNVKADAFDENVTPDEMASFTWVEPELELVVEFAELTRMGTLRHAEFKRPGVAR